MKQNRLVAAGLLAVIVLVVVLAVVAFSRTNLIANPTGYPTPTVSTPASPSPKVNFFSSKSKGSFKAFSLNYSDGWEIKEDNRTNTYNVTFEKEGAFIKFNQPTEADGEICYFTKSQAAFPLSIVLSERENQKIESKLGTLYLYYVRDLNSSMKLYSVCGPLLKGGTSYPGEVMSIGLITVEQNKETVDSVKNEIIEILKSLHMN